MKYAQCECMNIKHDHRCKNQAKVKCTTCNDHLCGGCAKNHHVHSAFQNLEQKSVFEEVEWTPAEK